MRLQSKQHGFAVGRYFTAAVLACCLLPSAMVAIAQDDSTPAKRPLSEEQQRIAAQFRHFEDVILRMSELTASTDPRRAALLRKAVARSKELRLAGRFEDLSKLLGEDQLAGAVPLQKDVQTDLNQLLSILLSEERDARLKTEQERIKEQIRRIKELINEERRLQSDTARGVDPDRLAPEQEKTADKAGKLAEEMKQQEQAYRSPADDSQNEDSPSAKEGEQGKETEKKADEKSDDGESEEKKNETKKDGSKPEEAKGRPHSKNDSDENSIEERPKDSDQIKDAKGEGEKSDSKPSDAKSQEGKPQQSKSQSKPQDGEPQEPSGEQEQTEQPQEEQQERSTSQRVQAARERMKEAQKKLEKAEKEGATEEQEQAIRELEQAKAELEEILRQLREEEMQRTLEMLEARFRRMLEMQNQVYAGTKRISDIAQAERDRAEEIEAGKLSRTESLIVIEGEKALNLLREDGSAVAMPEALEQVTEDMNQIVARLAEANVGEVTLALEQDVITALEEMIEAVKQAKEDLEKKKQQQGKPQEGEPGDSPLIEKLAELRMIRSLQMRVNTRTERYTKLVQGEEGQAAEPDLLEALQRLAEREDRIFQATRALAAGNTE